MEFKVLTLFPELIRNVMMESITGRAIEEDLKKKAERAVFLISKL